MGYKSELDPKENISSNIVRGFVVNNNDPKRIGRVQIRVYSMHGVNDDGITDENLPWAFPSFPQASYNSGSFIVPEVGSKVWILFEDGDKDKPVYIGCFYGIASQSERSLGYTDGNMRYQPQGQREVPHESASIEKQVLYKSPKGNKIVIDETNGAESISIVDIGGQVIRLQTPLSDEGSKNCGHVTDATVIEKDFKGFSYLKGKALMMMQALNKSFFSIESDESSTDMKMSAKGSEASIVIDVNGKCTVSVSQDDVTLSVGGTSLLVQAGKVTINAPVQINGRLTVKGKITTTG